MARTTRIDIDDMELPIGFHTSPWDRKIPFDEFAGILEASAGVAIDTGEGFKYRRDGPVREVEIQHLEMSGECFSIGLVIRFDEWNELGLADLTGAVYRASEKNFYALRDREPGLCERCGTRMPIYFTLR